MDNSQNIKIGTTVQISQQTVLSQQLRRSLELLALPLPALESRLTAELANNPMLEAEELPGAELPQPEQNNSDGHDDENDYENNYQLPDEWADNLPLPTDFSAENNRMDFMGSLPAPPPQLRTALFEELNASDEFDPQQKLIGTEIIGALNDDGYLGTTLADIAMLCDAGLDETEEVLHMIQRMAPPGVAARDLPESLALQLRAAGKMTDKMALLLQNGLTELEKNRPDLLIEKLGVSPEELNSMLKTLRSLNPVPGNCRVPGDVIITPDMEIHPLPDGSFAVSVRTSDSARLTISKFYEKLLDDASLSADDRAYLTEKLASAKELLKALAMRKSTLEKLGELIAGYQKDFLENGISGLKGMTMKEAAGILGVSESTISRCVADKLVETPQGNFPLKFFFSGKVDSAGADGISNQAVMDKIKNMIAAEDPHKPLSDEFIAQQLKKEGISVARRTVAKYREALKIPSSSLRRKFF